MSKKKKSVTTPPEPAPPLPPSPVELSPDTAPAPPAAATPAAEPSPETAPAPQKKIRYAVVGLGHIAQVAVLPGFAAAKNSELAALVSGDARKLRALKKQYPAARTYQYGQFDEVLADATVDAIYIALPNDQHLDCALRAMAAGKHVLCEKPLALTADDARLLLQAAARYGVKLMTAYRLHFEPANLATIALIRSGKLGDARYFSSTFSYQVTDPDNIRLKLERGGGPVYDIGTYCINAARYLMQDEPTEVFAMLARSRDERFDEVEEMAAVTLRFPRGRLATFIVSFGASTASRYEFVGTKGRVVLEPAYEYSEALKQTVTIDDQPEEKTFPHTDQFAGEIEVFSQCVLEDRAPEPTAEEAVADLRVIEAIFTSAEEGRPVRLKPFERAARPDPQQVREEPAPPKVEPVLVDAPHDD